MKLSRQSTKQDDGAKKKAERQTAQAVLITLEGLDVEKTMTDKQVWQFISVLGKLAGLLDDKNKVKSIN